jgi:hypothetical protein
MEEEYNKLRNLFYDKDNLTPSLLELYQLAKDNKIKLTQKQIKEHYNDQPVNQIYKTSKINQTFTRITSKYGAVGSLQMDLLILMKYRTKNNGYQYMLNIIDIYSRKAWSFAIKQKTPIEILPHIKLVIKEITKQYPHNIISMTHDGGSEFKGVIKQYFNDKHIYIVLANPEDNTKMRTMVVERFNRTMWQKLSKELFLKGDLQWVNIYEKITHKYNNLTHSFARRKPDDMFYNHLASNHEPYFVAPKKIFEMGDKVRYLITKTKFEKKSFTPNYSIDVYTINDKLNDRYYLKINNKVIRKSFLSRELILASKNDNGNKFKKEYDNNDKLNKFVNKQSRELTNVDRNTGIVDLKRLKPVNENRKDKYNIVGKKISVYWKAENSWFNGTVKKFIISTQKYIIQYQDGDIQEHTLNNKENWKIL